MKLKFYSLLCASVLGASSLMAANIAPSAGSALAPQWVNQVDAGINRQDPKGTVTSSDGQFVYLLTKFGTHVDGSKIASFYQYDMATGEKIKLDEYVGTPDNDGVESTGEGNFVVNKVDKNGELVWSVNSYLGEPMDYEFCATPDGGVAVLTKVRHSSADNQVLFGIKDVNGKDFQIPFVQPDVELYGKAYKIVVIKLSADGAIDWLKTADVSWDLSKFDDARTADPTADYVDLDGIAADPEGNIFIAGIHRNEIDFGNGVKAPFPANVKGWSGDVQDKTGDLFIVKYDTKGDAQWIFRSTQKDDKTVQCVNPDAMVYANGCLFIEGYIQSSGNSVFFADKEVQPGEEKTVFWFALDAATGTKVLYADNFVNVKSKKASMKPAGIAKYGENLYLCGQYYGDVLYHGTKIMDNARAQYKPYIAVVNAKTGEYINSIYWLSGIIVDARSVFEMENKVWCFGYDLSGFTSVYEIEKDFSAVVEHPVTKKQANFDTAFSACMIDNRMVGAIGGGRNSDIFMEGVDWAVKAETMTYTSVFASWDIDDTPLASDSDESWAPADPEPPTTGVEEAEANAIQVVSMNGGLNIVAAEEVEVNIFNLVGVNVYSAVVENGNTFVSLPKGIYIVNGTKTVVF